MEEIIPNSKAIHMRTQNGFTVLGTTKIKCNLHIKNLAPMIIMIHVHIKLYSKTYLKMSTSFQPANKPLL
jgi:hypothetical protein